jgi:hypothetical protein
MFCPKCGRQLEHRGVEMTCLRGNMALSRSMEASLEAAFVSKSVVPADTPFPIQIGGNWFCPGDGQRMTEVAGVIRCTSCHRSLNPFVNQLIELHHHEPIDQPTSGSKSPETPSAGRLVGESKAYRKRTAVAVLVWAVLPVMLSILAFVHGDIRSGALFAVTIVLALLASGLARSGQLARQLLAVLALAVAALPFAFWFVQAILLARGTGALAISDSPAGFLVNVFVELLFFVPLLAFAQSIWRHRSADR